LPCPGLTNTAWIADSPQRAGIAAIAVVAASPMSNPPCTWPTRLPTCAPLRIVVDAFHSKCRNSPFDGRPVQGAVLRTIVAGRVIHTAA